MRAWTAQLAASVVPGGPASTVGTYSNSWSPPSKVRLSTGYDQTNGTSRLGAAPHDLGVFRTSRLRVQGIGEQAGVRLDLTGTVTGAGPEKATQAIPFGARHHVQVEMGN
jgi:hypothetical protein